MAGRVLRHKSGTNRKLPLPPNPTTVTNMMTEKVVIVTHSIDYRATFQKVNWIKCIPKSTPAATNVKVLIPH